MLQKCQNGSSDSTAAASKGANTRTTKHLTTKMISQLVSEFRQLQIEVTEMKAANRQVAEAKDEGGSIRYQLYYGRYYEQEAR